MTGLLAFFLGLILGLMLTRRLRPLLFERVRALPVLVVLLLSALLPVLVERIWPSALWTEDRALLLALLILPTLLGLFFIAINCLPERRPIGSRPPTRWFHRVPLLIIATGLVVNIVVLLSNAGYWPIPESYLADISDPVAATAIRNQALQLKRLISADTALPWLGQVWRCNLLTALHLSLFPFISPGEVMIAVGLFGAGLTQFFGYRDTVVT